MPDANDIALLREYADCNSESAFSEIVHQHINLVYSVALRFTGNDQDAQDVTQAVFVILAKKAAGISPKIVLTGWLYETTRFTAMNFITSKTRRQAREQEAYMQSLLDSNTESIWRQLAPMLEEAMSRLSEKERTLVALRFFENRTVAETAAALGIQEWAARKRVERAVEKLQRFFAKRGVTSTTAILAGAISANSIQAAPVTLANAVTAAAIAKGAAASGSTLTLIKGALKIMAWTKMKTAIVVGVAAALAVGTTTTLIVRLNHHAGAQTDFPRSSWKNAGYAEPVSAFETAFWAASQNDGKMLFASLTPELQQKLEGGLRAGISPEEFLSQDKNSGSHLNGITGFRVVKSETISDDEVHLHFSIQGKQGEQIFKMKKVGDGWKMDDFPSGF